MQVKTMFRKSAELGITLVALSAVVLVGCGGGGSSGGTGTGTAAVTCTATGNATGVSASDCFLAEMVSVGLSGGSSLILPASSVSVPAFGYLKAQFDGSNYVVTASTKELVGGIWGDQAPIATDYVLIASGWTPSSSILTFVNNGDGSVSYSSTGTSSKLQSFVRTSLSGFPIVCKNYLAQTVACAMPGNYPTGATSYTASAVMVTDEYGLTSTTPATDVNGNNFTALPAIGDTVCLPIRGGVGFEVYQPITPTPAAGQNNYNVFFSNSGTCNGGAITTALTLTPSTALVSVKSTGIAAVPTVLMSKNQSILAVRNGLVYSGYFTPAGFSGTMLAQKNKAALNAELQANNLPAFP